MYIINCRVYTLSQPLFQVDFFSDRQNSLLPIFGIEIGCVECTNYLPLYKDVQSVQIISPCTRMCRV